MAQHDYVVENQSAPAFRADLNSALAAIVSQNSGGSAPTVTFANMIWYDTTNNQLKKRNEADSAWITLGTIDEVLNTFTPSGGAAIASQAEAEAGTDNTKMMTPLRSAQAIAAQVSAIYSNFQRFTASGTFTPPAGVTSVYAVVAGGGGGGAGYNSSGSVGGTGGYGGITAGVVSVSGATAVTVGAGGSGGTAGGNGAAGGTSSFRTLSATGGAAGLVGASNGASGTGSGGQFGGSITLIGALAALAIPVTVDQLVAYDQGTTANTTTATPVAYSAAGVNLYGARGAGGPTLGQTGRGGCGGAVLIFW